MEPSLPSSALVFILPSAGPARRFSSWGSNVPGTDGEALWLHLDSSEEAQNWLRGESGLAATVCDGLLAGGTRPGVLSIDGNLLVHFRGVNLNAGADPEDMVALRMWVEPGRILTVSRRPLKAVEDVSREIGAGEGPWTTGLLLAELGWHLIQRAGPVLEELEEALDGVEEQALEQAPHELQGRLAELRALVIALRRHLAPQREATWKLTNQKSTILGDEELAKLRLVGEQVARAVESLDELRDRSSVLYDLLSSRQTDSMNRRMLMLSLVTAVFLPLHLVVGLWGANVMDVPGSGRAGAFWILLFGVISLGLVQVWILRKLRWW